MMDISESNEKREFRLLPEGTAVANPVLRVRDVKSVLRFYTSVFGLEIAGGGSAASQEYRLSCGAQNRKGSAVTPLLTVRGDANATRPSHGSPGLYHIAIRVGSETELADTLKAVTSSGGVIEGFADHLVSKSLYVHDPEMNGIEIYCDTPRTVWKKNRDGSIMMRTDPLDIGALLRSASTAPHAFPAGAEVGHMHLKVSDLRKSVPFYAHTIGLGVTSDMSANGAVFLSAGSYHHHVALNVWESGGGPARRPSDTGLVSFEIHLPPDAERELYFGQIIEAGGRMDGEGVTISDPDGITLHIR
jgi:catechol 2,3-dioxygenase